MIQLKANSLNVGFRCIDPLAVSCGAVFIPPATASKILIGDKPEIRNRRIYPGLPLVFPQLFDNPEIRTNLCFRFFGASLPGIPFFFYAETLVTGESILLYRLLF
jgi:hypothetical protein